MSASNNDKFWFIGLLVSILFGVLSSWYFYHAGYDKGFKQGKWAEYLETERRKDKYR